MDGFSTLYTLFMTICRATEVTCFILVTIQVTKYVRSKK